MSDGTAARTLKREFRFRDAFIIAFVFISPIVALYAVFGLVISAAGPAGWWAFPIVLVLQILVALVLGVVVSRWPFEGGSYQWARRLRGENYGWAAAWAYIWTIVIVISSGAYAVTSFIPPLFNLEPFNLGTHVLVSIGVLVAITLINMIGPVVLKVLATLSLAAEVLGSVVLATILLIWHREQPISVLFDTAGAAEGNYLWGGLLLAIAFVGFGFAGFETVCSMAEEVEEPAKNLPKAIVAAIATIGVVVLYSSLALVLAIPDMPAVVAGMVADPAADTITAALGPAIAKPFFVLVIIGFLASIVTAQTSISRVIWSMSRDKVLPGAAFTTKLSGKHRVPARAICIVGALTIVVMLSAFSERLYATLISAGASGFYITMSLVILALLHRMSRGEWSSGPFRLGRATPVIAAVAGAWVVFEVINLAWPRDAGQPWFVTWAVLIGILGLALLGLVVWFSMRTRIAEADHVLEAQDGHRGHETILERVPFSGTGSP
jgi:amino acid transporter